MSRVPITYQDLSAALRVLLLPPTARVPGCNTGVTPTQSATPTHQHMSQILSLKEKRKLSLQKSKWAILELLDYSVSFTSVW